MRGQRRRRWPRIEPTLGQLYVAQRAIAHLLVVLSEVSDRHEFYVDRVMTILREYNRGVDKLNKDRCRSLPVEHSTQPPFCSFENVDY